MYPWEILTVLLGPFVILKMQQLLPLLKLLFLFCWHYRCRMCLWIIEPTAKQALQSKLIFGSVFILIWNIHCACWNLLDGKSLSKQLCIMRRPEMRGCCALDYKWPEMTFYLSVKINAIKYFFTSTLWCWISLLFNILGGFNGQRFISPL